MAVSTKIIKKRLRSIGNTKKITRAMEMVAAVKMRKSINQVLASRAYSQTAWQVILGLSKRIKSNHPLLKEPKASGKGLIVLISSNRGLCGGFNSQVINKALALSRQENLDWEFMVMGKKGAEYLARGNKKIIAEFEKPDVFSGIAEVLPLARLIIRDFVAEKYVKVCLVYTDYVSALIQRPNVLTLLPFEPKKDADLSVVTAEDRQAPPIDNTYFDSAEYIFEPNQSLILDSFLPRIIEVQVYQAMLESTASEHSARMMAMKSASSSASEMMTDLTLMFNQARQASITQEIAEITGSKAALE